MAEDSIALAVTLTEGTCRSRSGSSSGSSESDVSPICKISPLVVPVSTLSPRPLTPKKRHRAEMEEEARIQAAEQAKEEIQDKTLTEPEEPKEGQEPSVRRIPELEAQTPAEAESTSPATPTAKAKDVKIKLPSKEKDEKRGSTKKRKAGGDAEDPDSAMTTSTKRQSTPKKAPSAKSPTPTKSPKRSRSPRTPSTPTITGVAGGPPLPEGWRRVVTQRMQGESAGKCDVYIWSPSGRKFRSRPQLLAYLEETGSSLSIENFSFKHKGSSVTPARFRRTTPVKKEKKTPRKKTKTTVEKKALKRGRPRKNSVGKKSPGKQAAVKAKKGKQQRKVMKPPPDTGSKKASRAQQLQKLLVKINFHKPGDIREMSSDESSEASSEDDFDPGTTEEAGPDVSDISLTPSPPSSKKIRRHSSPAV